MHESYYSTKDWVERRKRKQLVKRELNNIDPTLCLINANGELIHAKWKAFKHARNIMSTSMNVLLERLGETYFAEAKQLKSKNKTCAQISLAAAEFFKVFLNHKNGFELPYAHTEYRTYDVKSNSFSKWKEGAWALDCAAQIGLAVVDLRELPGVEDALPDEKSTPYFYSVMAAFESGHPTFRGGQKMAVHIRLRESPIIGDGVRKQPRGLQVLAHGLCSLPPGKVRATWRFINWEGDKEGHLDFPARHGLSRPR